ncbi:MAG: XRE family transcriptional regulator [Candidatus Acidiferrales bacterium]
MAERRIAEVFAPGEFIKEELDARGWSQVDLSEILGRPPRLVSEIITAKRAITPETAKGLGDAFGTGAQFWMNLESAYRLAKVQMQGDDVVSRRASLYEKAPIKEMLRRNWIAPSENIDVLEKRVLDFFEIRSLEEKPALVSHAARKSTPYQHATPAQESWLFRAKHLARTLDVSKFTDKAFTDGLVRLRQLLPNPEDLRLVPKVLSEMGIRFLIIEPLTQTKIDGVCFWLDRHSPVIAISLRYDRINWFWHTLPHELGHIKNRDGLERDIPIDVDLVGEQAQPTDQKPELEQKADRFAAEFAINREELDDFVARARPLYSEKKILGFARRIGVHPGIVVGQLQYRREIRYTHFHKYLVKVRDVLTSSALTDGWGFVPPTISPRTGEAA